MHPHDPDFDKIRTVEDGRLRWHFGPATEWKRANPPVQTIEELSQRALLLSFSGRSDAQVAAELGLSSAQMAHFRAAWDRQEEERWQEIEADGQDEDHDDDRPDTENYRLRIERPGTRKGATGRLPPRSPE